jgi:membrane protease subunit HflK
MEHVLGNSDKVIIDQGAAGTGVVPYLPLDKLGGGQQAQPRPAAPQPQQQQQQQGARQ